MKLKSYAAILGIALLSFFSSAKAQMPHLDWAMGFGATGSDFGEAIALDGQGNVYTTGYFNGTVDFDLGPGVQNLVSHGYSDIFILKTDANGNYIWAKSIGGSGLDQGTSIAVSPTGNVYVTGSFAHLVDFDPGIGVDTLRNADDPCNTEIFILKLDANGNYQWAKSVKGIMTICTAATDVGMGIGIDLAEGVYVTGYWTGRADFNTSNAPADTLFYQSNGATISGDIFVLKLDSAGNFKWAKQIGNVLSDTGYGLCVSSQGSVYVTGLYGYDADFDPNAGTDTIVGYGNWDAFILKLDSAGNYAWARGFGGANDDRGFAVTADADDNVYATGHFSGTVDFDGSPAVHTLTTPSYAYGIYLLKLNSFGDYVWAKSVSGNAGGERDGTGITLDASKNIYVTGHFTDTVDFNPSTAPADTFYLSTTGVWSNTDAFILKTDSLGNFVWATSIGAAGVDRGKGIVVDASNNVYSTGYFQGTVDFNPEPGVTNLIGAGGDDIYIQKLDQIMITVPEQNDLQATLSLFPNPTHNNLFLQSKNMEGNNAVVTVMDISGRILFQKTLETSNGELNTTVDLQEFSSGIYFVQVKSGEQIFSAKVVRE